MYKIVIVYSLELTEMLKSHGVTTVIEKSVYKNVHCLGYFCIYMTFFFFQK
jgi:hypothetical protein